MVKTNQGIIGEQCKISYIYVLAVKDKYTKIARKGHYEKLLNTEFEQDRNTLFQADIVSDIPSLIEKDMVRESVSTMENEKATGASGVMSEMVQTADLIANLINQIKIEGVIPAK